MDNIQEILTRGVEEVIDRKHLESLLRSKKKLRVKLGIDPTSPNIHIGRAVLLLKLRAFQDLGHKAVFIVGDFTGTVGDTSDKDSERPMLTMEQVKANMKSYFKQAYKILNKDKTEVYYNSKWLKKIGFIELAKLANQFGLHEFEAREVIARRLKEGKRVSFHEMLYPLMQGYDSVAVKADVELGGTDQRFNLLTGRRVQPLYGQQPQDIVMMGLLEGTDGRKMSSSWGNVINITDKPRDMYGKIMSIPDNLIEKYFTLATRVPLSEIRATMAAGDPYSQKKRLAFSVAELYHGEAAAKDAAEAFASVFGKKELPDDIAIKLLPAGPQPVSAVMAAAGLAASKSEARRLIGQGGVKIDGAAVTEDGPVEINDAEKLFQVGKRQFAKIKAAK